MVAIDAAVDATVKLAYPAIVPKLALTVLT
jgi:hypothetical protein